MAAVMIGRQIEIQGIEDGYANNPSRKAQYGVHGWWYENGYKAGAEARRARDAQDALADSIDPSWRTR